MGIYTSLEDKWYDLVDWLNQYVPVAGLVDSVDRVVPSFILFIALLLLLLIGIFAIFFVGGGGIGGNLFEAEVTVLSRQGSPVSGALISFSQSCSNEEDLSERTNSEGKATFSACSASASLKVSKEGYSTSTEVVSFENNKARIYLSQLTSAQRIVNVKIKDSLRKMVTDADLYLLCIKGTKIDENLIQKGNQPQNGFSITIPQGCDSIQLKATAEGYTEKKELLGLNEENKVIILERTDLSGTVVFEVDSNSGKKESIISTTDELGREDTIIIDSTGYASRQYNAGKYTYKILLYSAEKSGTFEVVTGQTTTVEIFFSDVTPQTIAPIVNGTAKGVYLKLLDGNTGVRGAEVRLFYKKGNDTNYYTKLSSNFNGIVGHQAVSDANSREYYAIIKSLEYETKLVKLELKTEGETPQEVRMTKGGANLKVRVVDDIEKGIEGAVVSLWKNGFSPLFEETITTDENGFVEFKSLPSGTYKIRGVTKTHEGELDSISLNSDKTVVLTLLTGTGNVRFNLFNMDKSANAYCELYEKTDDGNILLSSTTTTGGYYQASSLVAGKNIFLVVPDTNYIYVESPIVAVKRGTQIRNIILYKKTDLPNQNKVQMFLEGVYESNPWTSNESRATKLMPGKKYYFLFTLIADNSLSRNTLANIFVSPKDSNTVDANTKLFLEDAFSTRTSLVRTSRDMNSSIIPFDPLNPTNPVHAKQLNVYFGEILGLNELPILAEVTVDSNAKGSAAIYWEGIIDDTNNAQVKSILYSKEFTIGQSFCFGLGKCPELLFSNYIKRVGDTEWVPFEDYDSVQIEEVYDLNIIVENLTQREIGASSIKGAVDSGSKSKIQFEGDLNTVSSDVTLPQFGVAWSNFKVEPLKESSPSILIESLVKGNELNDYNGNNKKLRFEIKNKQDIELQVIATSTPGVIYSNSEYPLFYVKAVYKLGKKPVNKANWYVKVKGPNESIKQDYTDENGEWLGELDLSSYPAGTVLVFTATDTNHSNPGYLEITLTEGFSDPTTETVADCVSVKINGSDIKGIKIPTITSTVGSTGGSFKIDSNCTDDREIRIMSDLAVTPGNKFILKAGQSQDVTLDDPASVVVSRGGMLGAYPMQIRQVAEGKKFSQIGFIDIIVKDDSSIFSIENPILDMRSNSSVSSKIINNRIASDGNGRLDIYYPQMDISTNSVGLTYTKPGIPETIDFNAVVKSHAIEALTTAYIYGSEIDQSNRKNKCRAKTKIIVPEELKFTDLAQQHAELKLDTLTGEIENAPSIETPDSIDRDPTKSLYDLPVPIQNKIISELYATSGTLSKRLEIINKSAFFADDEEEDEEENESEFDEDLHGTPNKPVTGDRYEIIPEMAGSLENSNCQSSCSLNSGCNTGECATDADDESMDNVEMEGDYYEEEEGVPNEEDTDDNVEGTYSSECNKCEINYNRIRIDPFPPEGFDGSTCSGVALAPTEDETEEELLIDGDVGTDTGYLGDTAITTASLLGGLNEELDINGDTIWTKIEESVLGRLAVLRATGCHPCKVLYFGDWIGGLYTKGKKKSWLHSVSGGLWGSGGTTARLYVQDEYMHAVTFFNERVSTWEKTLSFKPKEGTVVRLEPSYGYKIDPRWSNIDEIITEEDIAEYEDKNILLEETIVVPHGLVPFSVTQSGCGGGYDTPDVNNTLVEYRNNGLIYAEIPAETIPEGLRVFLKGGYIYAEYIGDQNALTGNEIDFNVSKVNLQGSEYAILTVRDWVNGEKVERIFQVKLMGNPGNCYSFEGIAGLTGKEFAPRLSFNWDWNGINYDQCDSTNSSYTYCDATQFTISLIKRLELINAARIANNNAVLPKYSSFYAYLIKDGYSDDFLDDFDEYYSTTNFSSVGFNTTSTFTGYDLFLDNIDYNIKIGSANYPLPSTGLPDGGLYRIEIETNLINPAIKSLFDGEKVNAKINVTFTLINKAQNYNLFYETPFDGAVGKRNVNGATVFDRQGYGVSITNGQLPLTNVSGNDSLIVVNYSGNPFVPINYSNSTSLEKLMDRDVLDYYKDGNVKVMSFNPMQPTPVVMRINRTNTTTLSTSDSVTGLYTMKGHDETLKVDRSWDLISSTLGNSGKCTDFKGQQVYSFIEQTRGKDRYITWDNVTKSGTIELATFFFTPPSFVLGNQNQSIDLTSIFVPDSHSSKVNLFTVEGTLLKQGTAIQLDYFGDQEYTKYNSLKGMFEMIAEGKLCISQSGAERMLVWWNQEYLDKLMDSVGYNKSNSCLD